MVRGQTNCMYREFEHDDDHHRVSSNEKRMDVNRRKEGEHSMRKEDYLGNRKMWWGLATS